jgi:hypothetical protein
MRAIQLLTLALLATAVKADNFSNTFFTAGIFENPFNFPKRLPVLGCSVDAQGTTSAGGSFGCDFTNVRYRGGGGAETGIGPFGIGVSVGLNADGSNFPSQPFLAAGARASFSWSQDAVIRGAEGDGTALVTITLSSASESIFGPVDLELFNHGPIPVFFEQTFSIPVTFGVLYTNTLDGSTAFCIFQSEHCGIADMFVSSLSFLDANGNPLPNAMLVDVPESSSWLLLATCGIPIMIWRLMRQRHFQ